MTNSPVVEPTSPRTDGKYARLLSPTTIRGHVLRNRMITTAHSIMAPWHPAGDETAYVDYCRRRAKGGAALLITQPVNVEPFHDWPWPVIDRLKRLADAVHEEGALVTPQVVSFGRQIGSHVLLDERAEWSFNGGQDEFGEAAHRMTAAEIRMTVDAYGRTAEVFREAGLDGLELHGAHGYLLQQSYSPWGNGRDDEWGEQLAFSTAVLEAVRSGLGDDRILGWRMTADDHLREDENGLTPEELQDVARRLVDTGHIDFMNLSIGTKAPAYSQPSVASFRYPKGYDLELAGGLREAIDARVPVVGVGGIVDPGMAEQALADGMCDLIGMTRGFLSDPDMGVKILRGDEDRIRTCVRVAECNSRRVDGKTVQCWHNPEFGREAQFAALPAPTRRKRVLVVGAGVAGLQAAEVAVKRGHEVRIVEATDRPGGRLRTLLGTRAAELFGTVDHLVGELRHEGVEVEYGRRLTAAGIRDAGVDEVVVATGAAHDLAAHGLDRPGIVTVDDAIAHGVPEGATVLVVDRTGHNPAGVAVEKLALEGHDVVYVTPFDRLVTNSGYNHRLDYQDLFRRSSHITAMTFRDLRSYEDGRVTLIDPDGVESVLPGIDVVVAAVHPVPCDGLVHELQALGVTAHTCGDVIAPRGVTTATREATLLAQTF
ncbi:FAD-dependent oxidoreductase [Streptomyces sp. NPDC046924]|uniref:oxidoreductase n=1 Tax=Streptomyces sp. NPDC046924 TaxID=3155136 RepID=UPI0033ED26C2